ncbi:MAG TPA: N-acetyltransferase [Candidatus Omnitrophota bacterium]|nr:N-acetyltransferase [Candidatus Omnitrophota bacterium]
MVSIRQETAKDIEGIRELNKKVFGRDAESRVVDNIRASANFIPELSLVAEQDGCVIGHILFSRIKIRCNDGETDALILAPLAVSPDMQKCGIGSLLVREGLRTCKHLGHKIIIVVGHPKYYPRFGFLPAAQNALEPEFIVPIPNEAFMVTDLYTGALKGLKGKVVFPVYFNECAQH